MSGCYIEPWLFNSFNDRWKGGLKLRVGGRPPYLATHSLKLVTRVQILGIQLDLQLPNELQDSLWQLPRFLRHHTTVLAHVLECAVPRNWALVTR